ncbi:MAG: hypothetical protein HYX27_03810 [Acidobacteria bacterium]|nr:hypothetical protein [Acidobacteriota bacterium]
MRPHFCNHPDAFRALIQTAAPVRPNAETAEPLKPSEWAQKQLEFTPSAKQAEVLDIEAKYLILCCNRQWGKTTTIALKALHRALTIPNQSIVIISRTKLQAGILIDRACDFAARLGHKIRRVLGHSYSLKLANGSRIFAVAHSQDTSVGNTAHVLIVDEAALVKDEVFFTVSPFVGRTHGSLWLMSTPQRQAGFFYNIWHNQNNGWHKIFSSIKDCPEIDPEFLEMQKRADPIKYKQDFECQFIQPANRLFTREMLNTMYEPIPDRRRE